MSKQLFAAALVATSTVFALESPEQCATACNQAYSLCQVTPVNGTSANQSYCASQLASCVGYNPFKASGYEKPTACVHGGSSTSTTCTTTSTYAVSPPAPTYADACAADCAKKFDACSTAKDANHAFCGSQYASCLNFNPFTNTATFITPTACAKPTTLSTSCSTTGSAPAPTTTKAAPAPAYKDACAKKCADELNKCQGSGDPNEAACASSYAQCLGFNPFTNTATFITPTACAASTGAPGPVHTGSAPAPSAPKPATTAAATTAAAASQIGDGQVQAPTGQASQISDGQVQAPTGTAAAPAPASTTQTQVTNGASALSFSNLLFLVPAVFFL